MHERRASRLAAYFAVSNIGLMVYMDEELAGESRYISWHSDPGDEICSIAGHLMEDDSHEAIFSEEAHSWFEQFKHLSVEEAREQYHWNVGKVWFDSILDAPEEDLDAMKGY